MILVDSAPDLLTTAGFTVTAWLRLADPLATRACAVTKGLSGGSFNSWALCVEPSRQLFFYTVASAASDNLRSAAVLSLQTWHHAAIRWDGQTKQVPRRHRSREVDRGDRLRRPVGPDRWRPRRRQPHRTVPGRRRRGPDL